MDGQSTAISASNHQCVKYPLREAQGTIPIDNDSFLEAEAYVDARIYIMKSDQEKGERVAEAEDSSNAPRSPLVRFTKRVTQLFWSRRNLPSVKVSKL